MSNENCTLVRKTGFRPFKRCMYCDQPIRECFGIQFMVIASAIIALLILIFFISDLPALVFDTMILITLLVALLAFLASKETNEIVLNNVLLSQLNKQLEERVKNRTIELEHSNDALIKADQMKNEFIGVINHELKTPITSVISGIELIRVHGIEKLNESQKKMIDIMDKSGRDMLRLANNLLDVSKIESGKIVLYPDHFPLVSMMEEVVQALRPEADRKHVQIETRIDDSISTIYADPDRIKQAFFNIIDNAIKYSNEGGHVSISAKVVDHIILIEVSDKGLGIKEENIGRIFEKFARRAPGYKGTGLGLYITKSLVEAHNGSVEVDSKYGSGSTFRIKLPKV